jgi:GNAT superfamily N-acetyltransferase
MRLVPIGLQIRPMGTGDYNGIYRLYRQMQGIGILSGENNFARIFNGFFDSGDHEAFVAEVHNNVIGLVTLYYLDVFHHSGQVACIQELLVTEEFRGRGVGKSLVDFAKRKAVEKHCHGLEVATDLWQSGAKSFYESCGLHNNLLGLQLDQGNLRT